MTNLISAACGKNDMQNVIICLSSSHTGNKAALQSG